ncbi:MAG: transglycosylase SLT domain-containing protein [Candidatus Paceibacterota bacterium]|jgi:hypothetical protein
MRSRAPLFAFLLVVVSFALPLAAHAAIPFFGPIIPPQSVTGVAGSDVCAAGWGMIIIVINNIISFLITIAIVFVAPLTIAYAGFLYVVNPMNPSGITKAKGILWNTVIGIVVALAGWMIVDAVMAVLYNSTAPVSDGSTLETWSNIINWNGNPCLIQAGSMKDLKQAVPTAGVTVVTPQTGTTISTVGPSGQSVTVSFAPTQSNASLQAGYTAASAYSAQIASACSASTIPNCTTVITALIAAESGGKPTTGCNSSGSCGIMQLTQANGGTSCASTNTVCISTQITKGVQLFQKGYNKFPNIPNALAAYNSGGTTQARQSASGLNSAMVSSVNCQGYYAWQCPINPGGLVETQNYVANICKNIASHGGTCN